MSAWQMHSCDVGIQSILSLRSVVAAFVLALILCTATILNFLASLATLAVVRLMLTDKLLRRERLAALRTDCEARLMHSFDVGSEVISLI